LFEIFVLQGQMPLLPRTEKVYQESLNIKKAGSSRSATGNLSKLTLNQSVGFLSTPANAVIRLWSDLFETRLLVRSIRPARPRSRDADLRSSREDSAFEIA
jgi:hypothetical protein